MEMDAPLREMLFKGASLADLRQRARSSGRMTTLLDDGVRKVLDGTTTIGEILRIAHGLD
jgi:type IV pilus assembly protein PilB